MPRTSVAESFKLRSLLIGSVIQFGDCLVLAPRSKVLAIGREYPVFSNQEPDFADYPFFSRPFPRVPITENVRTNIINESPYIKAGNISIHGVSTAGCVQIGSNLHIDTETRIKHFRQFLYPPKFPEVEEENSESNAKKERGV